MFFIEVFKIIFKALDHFKKTIYIQKEKSKKGVFIH